MQATLRLEDRERGEMIVDSRNKIDNKFRGQSRSPAGNGSSLW